MSNVDNVIYYEHGCKYSRDLSKADIATIWRKELKRGFPDYTFTVRRGRSSLTVTVTGSGLLDDRSCITELGKTIQNRIGQFCHQWNRCESDCYGDYYWSNFYLHVELRERLNRAAVLAEAERLKRDYWIKDMETLKETSWNMGDKAPLTEKAIDLLYEEFKPKIRKPEPSSKVTEEFLRWVEKVKAWTNNPSIQFNRGPMYWQVLHGGQVLCFVDASNGTIYKAQYRGAITSSPRGTIFDGHNIFDARGRLLDKGNYDWMTRYSAKAERQFSSFYEALAHFHGRTK